MKKNSKVGAICKSAPASTESKCKAISFNCRPLVVFGALFLFVSLVLLGYVLRWTPLGFSLDDSWIHLTYARNLWQTGMFTLSLPTPSMGTTSVLWTIILAVGGGTVGVLLAQTGNMLAQVFSYTLSEPFNPWVLWTLIFGIVSGMGGLLLFAKFLAIILSSKLSGRQYIYFIPLALLATNLIYYFHVLSGLETVLFIALALGAFVAVAQEKTVLAGILAGLTAMTRIEGVLVFCALLFFVVLAERKDQWSKRFVSSAIPFFSLLGVLFCINYFYGGSLLPNTLEGRKWLYFAGQTVPSVATFIQYWQQVGLFFIDKFFALQTENRSTLFLPSYDLGTYILAVGSMGLLFAGVIVAGKTLLQNSYFSTKGRALFLSFFAWVIGHNLLYAVVFPTGSNLGRYQAVNFFLLYMLIAVVLFTAHHTRPITPLLKIIYVTVVIFTAFLFVRQLMNVRYFMGMYRRAVNHINETHKGIGMFIAQHTEPESIIATFDIGAVSFFGQRTIVDLGCLTDSTCGKYLQEGKTQQYLIDKKATYLVMPESSDYKDFLGMYEQKSFTDVCVKTLITSLSIPYYDDYLMTMNAFPRMSLYKLQCNTSE